MCAKLCAGNRVCGWGNGGEKLGKTLSQRALWLDSGGVSFGTHGATWSVFLQVLSPTLPSSFQGSSLFIKRSGGKPQGPALPTSPLSVTPAAPLNLPTLPPMPSRHHSLTEPLPRSALQPPCEPAHLWFHSLPSCNKMSTPERGLSPALPLCPMGEGPCSLTHS